MTKKHFIALADKVKYANRYVTNDGNSVFGPMALKFLADFCEDQNNSFKRERWFDYIRGDCGPNGGNIKR
jgi:hypothetical protein